jgi:hypothetical protein
MQETQDLFLLYVAAIRKHCWTRAPVSFWIAAAGRLQPEIWGASVIDATLVLSREQRFQTGRAWLFAIFLHYLGHLGKGTNSRHH